MVKLTEAQILLQKHLGELGIPTVSEYQFAKPRRWRFDLADVESKIGFECDGGMFRGGHVQSFGLEKDYEKQNYAQLDGWKVLRFTNRQILRGEAKKWLSENL
jgi:very-short-patch-repair endonuclease